MRTDDFVLALGGHFIRNVVDIHYVNMKTLQVTKSKLVCPIAGDDWVYQCKAYVIIPNNEVTNKMLVHGYVRKVWKRWIFRRDLSYPPHYLIQIIEHYYQQDVLYLFRANILVWEVLVDDILN